MRGKRSKQYRKLLKQFELAFGFRQPYQVLVDADILMDSSRFAMDLQQYLERTLHGEVKVLVTQCSMRHLYAHTREPGMERTIDKAKAFERRRCGHHPDQFPEPLSTLECLGSVVDPGGRGVNKHRYVVASQDPDVRSRMRGIPGVPLIYISRSVMIMEPMAGATTRVVNKGERVKFRAEIKQPAAGSKRKRDGDDSSDEDGDEKAKEAEAEKPKTKKKKAGLKGPNPLAVKKPKKKPEGAQPAKKAPTEAETKTAEDGASEPPAKRKRKRKHKTAGTGEGEGEGEGEGSGAPQAASNEIEVDS